MVGQTARRSHGNDGWRVCWKGSETGTGMAFLGEGGGRGRGYFFIRRMGLGWSWGVSVVTYYIKQVKQVSSPAPGVVDAKPSPHARAASDGKMDEWMMAQSSPL